MNLGIGEDDPSLASEIFTPCFGKGSLLQFANVTVVLENGHRLSNTDDLLGAES